MTKTNIPRLRFREFDGEWKEDILSSLLDENDGIRRGPFGSSIKKSDFDENNDYGVYEQQNAIHDVNAIRYFINENKYEELKKFTVQSQDIIMSGAGTIGKIAVIPNNHIPGVFNQALIRIRKNKTTDLNYLVQFIKSDNVQRMLKSNNPGSAIQNLKPMKYIKKMDVSFPNSPEQQMIGSFFAKIDKLIELQTQKLEQLKKLKRGYLQKMFPRDGESISRLRFSGFSGEWKEEKLSELVDISTGFPFKSSNFDEDGNFTVITNKSIHSDKKFVLNNGDKINLNKGYNKYILEKGDILITMDGNVGISAVVNDQRMVLAQRVARISHNDKLSDYIFAFLTSNNFISGINKISIGSIIKHISLNDIKDFKCFIPDEEETLKIGNFFNKIDRLICTEADYLERLKLQKKAYLQKMFI